MDMTPEQFWSMSPRLFALKVDGYFSRENRAGYYFREAFALQVNMNRKENTPPITGQEILPLYGEKKQRSNSRRKTALSEGWTQDRIDMVTARFNLAPEQLNRYYELRKTEPFKYESEGDSDPRVFPSWSGWQSESVESGNTSETNQSESQEQKTVHVVLETGEIESRIDTLIKEFQSIGLSVFIRNPSEKDDSYAHRLDNYLNEYRANLIHQNQ